MAKKKMTPSQAAAARRPEDWEPPENAKKSDVKKASKVDMGLKNVKKGAEDKGTRKIYLGFIILFVIMGLAAPFLVVFFSNLFGIG